MEQHDIKTWQQAVDFTFRTRHEWRHGNGAKTSRYNCNHVTRLAGASYPIKRINQAVVTQWCIELEDEGKSDATINRIVSAISTVLNHCASEGVASAPGSFKRRKELETRLVWYTHDEVEGLIDLSIGVYDRKDLADIISFAAYTGMRQAEILRIRKKDICFLQNYIHVGGVPTQKTKAGNWRVIPIHNDIKQLVADRCSQSTREDARLFGSDWTGKDQLYRAFKKVRKLLPKDDQYNFHTLRHSFATWNAEAGVPLRTLMALCGHKRIETTLRYAKATDTALRDAINAI